MRMFLQRIHLLWALPSSGRGRSNLFRKLFALLTSNWRRSFPASYLLIIAIAVLWAVPKDACAQLYVFNRPEGRFGGEVVSEYNATTGAAINANFITGLTN